MIIFQVPPLIRDSSHRSRKKKDHLMLISGWNIFCWCWYQFEIFFMLMLISGSLYKYFVCCMVLMLMLISGWNICWCWYQGETSVFADDDIKLDFNYSFSSGWLFKLVFCQHYYYSLNCLLWFEFQATSLFERNKSSKLFLFWRYIYSVGFVDLCPTGFTLLVCFSTYYYI